MTLDPDGVPRRAMRLEAFETTAEALVEYEGEYASDELQVSYWIAPGGGRLLLRAGDRECGALDAVKADSLLSTLGELAFERDDRGSIIGFRLNGARAKGLAFRKR